MGKVFGVVAEYNPFHNGHKAMIEHYKENGYDYCVAVMSGNFVQRATPAITEKRVRAESALGCGVDLVIELPVPYATASAAIFAQGAISLLRATGVVDGIAFGSEEGSVAPLKIVGETLGDEGFREVLREKLANGDSFPKARSLALEEVLGEKFGITLAKPNNLLGIEYIRAAQNLGWSPVFETIKRVGVSHDSSKTVESYASASLVRSLGDDWDEIEKFVPTSAVEIYKKAWRNGMYPADFRMLEIAVMSRLRSLTVGDIRRLPDISEGIENLFYKAIRGARSLEEVMERAKTKRYTLSRVRRLILNGFLGIDSSYAKMAPPYIRVLGFSEKGEKLLGKMKQRAILPFSHSLAVLEKHSPIAGRFARLEAAVSDQYTLSLPTVQKCGYDYREPVVRLL